MLESLGSEEEEWPLPARPAADGADARKDIRAAFCRMALRLVK